MWEALYTAVPALEVVGVSTSTNLFTEGLRGRFTKMCIWSPLHASLRGSNVRVFGNAKHVV